MVRVVVLVWYFFDCFDCLGELRYSGIPIGWLVGWSPHTGTGPAPPTMVWAAPGEKCEFKRPKRDFVIKKVDLKLPILSTGRLTEVFYVEDVYI